MRHFLLAAAGALMGLGSVAMPSVASAQAQQQGIDADTFIRSALQTCSQLDQGGAAAIYPTTSVVFRNAVGEQQFVEAMNARAQQLAGAVRRDWVAVTRNAIDNSDPNLTPGLYVTVVFQVIGQPGTPVRTERVTFRADEDRVWRLAGVAIDAV